MIELGYRLTSLGSRSILVGVLRHDEPVSIGPLPLHFEAAPRGSEGTNDNPKFTSSASQICQ